MNIDLSDDSDQETKTIKDDEQMNKSSLKRGKMNKEVEDLSQKLADKESREKELEDEILKKTNEFKVALDQKDEEINLIKTQSTSEKALMEEKIDELNSKTKTLIQEKEQYLTIETEWQSLRQENETLKKNQESFDNQISQIQELTLKIKESENKLLQAEQALSEQKKAAEEAADQAQKTIQTMTEKVAQDAKKIQEQEEALSESTKQLKKIQEEKGILQQSLDDIHQKLKLEEDQKIEKEQQLISMKKDINNKIQQNEILSNNYASQVSYGKILNVQNSIQKQINSQKYGASHLSMITLQEIMTFTQQQSVQTSAVDQLIDQNNSIGQSGVGDQFMYDPSANNGINPKGISSQDYQQQLQLQQYYQQMQLQNQQQQYSQQEQQEQKYQQQEQQYQQQQQMLLQKQKEEMELRQKQMLAFQQQEQQQQQQMLLQKQQQELLQKQQQEQLIQQQKLLQQKQQQEEQLIQQQKLLLQKQQQEEQLIQQQKLLQQKQQQEEQLIQQQKLLQQKQQQEEQLIQQQKFLQQQQQFQQQLQQQKQPLQQSQRFQTTIEQQQPHNQVFEGKRFGSQQKQPYEQQQIQQTLTANQHAIIQTYPDQFPASNNDPSSMPSNRTEEYIFQACTQYIIGNNQNSDELYFDDPKSIEEILSEQQYPPNPQHSQELQMVMNTYEMNFVSKVKHDNNSFFRSFFSTYLLSKMLDFNTDQNNFQQNLTIFMTVLQQIPVFSPIRLDDLQKYNITYNELVFNCLGCFGNKMSSLTPESAVQNLAEYFKDPVFDFGMQIVVKSIVVHAAKEILSKQISPLYQKIIPSEIEQALLDFNSAKYLQVIANCLATYLNTHLVVLNNSLNQGGRYQLEEIIPAFGIPESPLTLKQQSSNQNIPFQLALWLEESDHYNILYTKDQAWNLFAQESQVIGSVQSSY